VKSFPTNKEDLYRPNHVIATLLVAAVILVLLLGQSLWIPASKIENLHLRSIVLAVADEGASIAKDLGVDTQVPALRSAFLAVTGLDKNTNWDTRYYNRRNATDRSDFSGDPASSRQDASGLQNASDQSAAPQTVTVSSPGSLPAARTQSQAALAKNIVHSASNPLAVYMFGDSQVFSLGSGLSRLAGKDGPIKIDFLAIHSSGFIRDDYFDWPAKLSDEFAANHYDAVVLMLGMNDYQSFRDATGAIIKKKTPAWETAYKDKCRAIIDLALQSVPRVYWIGMPVVKNSVYNESLSYIDSVQASLAAEYSSDVLVRVSLSDTIPGTGKKFVSSVDEAGGKTVRVMEADGSHFTVEGGERVMLPLFDRLARDFQFDAPPVAQQPD
jgi:hypothetical protein